jgi:hypothetical protein
MARKDKEWMKVGLKWKCKIGICIVAYCVKWFLTKHLKEVHGLVAKKAKPRKFSTFDGGLQHQDHAKICILGNDVTMQRQNDQKVVNRAHDKIKQKWDKLIIITKLCSPLPKPTLVRLASK